METIVAIMEMPGVTAAQYDTLMTEMEKQGKTPKEELISHAAFQKGDSWCVIDVWRSQEVFMDFGKNTLLPLFAHFGITPAKPEIYPVHSTLVPATAQ